ncbi:exov-like protein [Rubellimicrobium arenae]|uniref:exov-like protein n=1 Tax=Rubellimicrobium arenae TaxID=2817372 RepID=UPI001B3021AE|nr:exov-like protein [Rubellimicrobium arenae]
MRLFYNATTTNFGDHINSWLWPRLIPELIDREEGDVLVGIGSLLKADLDRMPGRKVIFGTGSGYGNPPPPRAAQKWQVYGVRGPLTARMFGLPDSAAITDGAWLVDHLPEFNTPKAKGQDVVFVPHWTSAAYGNWKPAVEMAGMKYIDPLDDGPSVLSRIATARLAVVESLHGAIFADYFRTPWIAVSSPGRVLHFKWLDWAMSLGLDYRSYQLPASDMIDFLTQGQTPSHEMPRIAARSFTPDQFRYEVVAQRHNASLAYRSKIKAKGVLRAGRARVLAELRKHRDGIGMGRWNEAHRDALAEYLTRLAMVEGTLSHDAVRANRLARLAEALHNLRRDQGVATTPVPDRPHLQLVRSMSTPLAAAEAARL